MNDSAAPDRQLMLRRFVSARFGLRGTLALHRAAIGWDLLRAPINLLLAPVFLLVRLAAVLAGQLGWRQAAVWLKARNLFLETAVSKQVARDVRGLVADVFPGAEGRNDATIRTYVGTRSAVAEITTMLCLVVTGVIVFRALTPGVVSLAGPVAELRAFTHAVEAFPLGSFLGRAWYGVFPVHLALGEILVTGLALAVLASILTTFAGLIADPIQVVLGIHRRRLARLIERIEAGEADDGLEREHLAARLGDLSDAVLSLWRMLR